MPSKQSGIIYQLDDGRFAIVYYREQQEAFYKLNKLLCHIVDDYTVIDPKNVTGVLKSISKLQKKVGYID